jgi:hypothetical protein
MVKNIFLLPLGETVNSAIVQQILNLKSWCDKNESSIITSIGSTNDCMVKNIISTLGNGGKNPVPSKEVDYYIIIDKNIIFGEEHLDLLSKTDNPFVCGWKSTTNSENGNRVVVAGKWDEEFYKEHGSMPVLRYEDLVKVQESDPERLIEVDYSEFGFVRIHRSIFEKMQYPFFRLNVQDFNGTPDLLSDDISFCLNCTKETGIKPHVLSGLHVNSISFVKLP